MALLVTCTGKNSEATWGRRGVDVLYRLQGGTFAAPLLSLAVGKIKYTMSLRVLDKKKKKKMIQSRSKLNQLHVFFDVLSPGGYMK